MLKKFKKNDILRSCLKTYPHTEFLIVDRKVYFNKKGVVPGKNVSNVCHIDTGYVSLYEMNVDRPASSLIYPYIVKGSSLDAFKTVSTSDFNSNYAYGDVLSASYPLDATISVDRFAANASRPMITALENTLDYYKVLSPHYSYGDKETQKISLISIPSIFYGSSIKKGSIKLGYYISGTLLAQLEDTKRNGELIQTLPYGSIGSGSVAGVCLYNEGFLVLTGAWSITSEYSDYYEGNLLPLEYPQWFYFGSTGSISHGVGNIPSSSFTIDFDSINYINTLTMNCFAGRGEMDQSNNPSFIEYGQNTNPITGTYSFKEPMNLKIKNITKSPFIHDSGSFSKVAYFNKIVIFDNEKRPIAVAKMSKAIRKREEDDLIVKLKIDTL